MELNLYLFNSATKKKEKFIPINSNKITMYVCGPTLYDVPHIGNARSLIVFDILFRVLKSLYNEVVYVRNITDIDDKILNKAIENNISFEKIVEQNLVIFKENLSYLNLLTPTIEPLATHYLNSMIEIISILIEKGYAYKKDNHVFYNVKKFPLYGSLSCRGVENKTVGLGNDSIVKDIKNHPQDFVLWKPSKHNEPSWDTPFGKGRPGWHIECSAMVWQTLGKQIDIHGGGCDLLFPHHENEQAQTLAAFDTTYMAKYWIHNAFVNMNNRKMSKSLGNITKVTDLAMNYKGEVVRLAFLLTHYRHPINFTSTILNTAQAILNKMYNALRNSKVSFKEMKDSIVNEKDLPELKVPINGFKKAILDDLNIPLALTEMQKVVSLLNTTTNRDLKYKLVGVLKEQGNILGILQQDVEDWFTQPQSLTTIDIDKINHLIESRKIAKNNKDYMLADAIREQLLQMDIILEDKKDNTTWRKINNK